MAILSRNVCGGKVATSQAVANATGVSAKIGGNPVKTDI
jgi:hypothetical protein